MRVLLAGASGALGLPLTRALIARGHSVLGLMHDAAHAGHLAALGAQPLLANALDRDGVLSAVRGHRADAVINELTSLRKAPLRHSGMALTDRLRSEGTANLIAAAEILGARRFLTQSIILGYGYRDCGDRVLTEDDPFGRPAGNDCDPHLAAMLATEQLTFAMPEGVALRYGLLYGGDAEQMRTLLAKRLLPMTGSVGVLGWVHHEDAVAATVAALEQGGAGRAYNVVDDQPASWQEVYSAMAAALGTPSPPRLPEWTFRLLAPYVAAFAVDTSMRVSNARARGELGWRPAYPTYRDGVRAMRVDVSARAA